MLGEAASSLSFPICVARSALWTLETRREVRARKVQRSQGTGGSCWSPRPGLNCGW